MTLAIPSADGSPFGLVGHCGAQADGTPRGVSDERVLHLHARDSVAWVCQPQYEVQKPLVSATSA